MGGGPAVAGVIGAEDALAAAVATAAGADCRAMAASVTVGSWMVEPTTIWASSDRPLAAAKARVVMFWAAASDHRVSPGATVWATPAEAALGAAKAAPSSRAGRSRAGRMSDTRTPPRLLTQRRKRGYGASLDRLQRRAELRQLARIDRVGVVGLGVAVLAHVVGVGAH